MLMEIGDRKLHVDMTQLRTSLAGLVATGETGPGEKKRLPVKTVTSFTGNNASLSVNAGNTWKVIIL